VGSRVTDDLNSGPTSRQHQSGMGTSIRVGTQQGGHDKAQHKDDQQDAKAHHPVCPPVSLCSSSSAQPNQPEWLRGSTAVSLQENVGLSLRSPATNCPARRQAGRLAPTQVAVASHPLHLSDRTQQCSQVLVPGNVVESKCGLQHEKRGGSWWPGLDAQGRDG